MPVKIPASLVRHLQGGRCVLFAGAGLSAQAKLPNWGKLLGDLVQAVGAEDPDEQSTAELKKLLEAGRYLDVADECKERLGAGYAELLSRTLQVGSGPVPEAHQLVMKLPFAAWITTNYDKLLEQAHFQVRGGVPKTLTHLDADTFGTLLFDGAPFILKAHGDVDRPESLIFTTRDYREIIHSNPAFNAVFSAILLTRAVLFVGYSLNDPDFRLLLDRQLTTFKKFVPERYALMAGVGDVEREVLRRTAQIKVISYPAGQHQELVSFLRDLQAQVAPRPPEPEAEETAGAAKPDLLLGFDGTEEDEEVAKEKGSQPRLSPPPRPAAPPPPTLQVSPAPISFGGAPRPSGNAGAGASNPKPPRREAASAVDVPPPARGDSGPPRDNPFPAAPPAPGGAPVPPASASDDLGASAGAPVRAGPAVQPASTAVLALTARGYRTAAVLKDGAGEIVAQGTGPLTTGSALMRLLSLARNDVADIHRIGEVLADQLHRSVIQALENLFGETGVPSIGLELDAELEARPWELLQVRGKPLALQAAVSRAPVGLSTMARGRPHLHRPIKALLIGDPAGDLAGAREEVSSIARVYTTMEARPTVLMGRDATLEAVIALVGGATAFDVVHYAGHAWYDAQDVYLALAGGAHLTDDAIRPALSHRPPCVLMLNSHYTAFIPSGVSPQGPEAMKATAAGRIGFTEVAMRAGVGAFVGCFGSPNDEGAAAVAIAFHRALLEGVPVAKALHLARNDRQVPKDDPTPLLYALSGYGDLKLE